jgi:lipoic acid synthetase
MLTKSGLMVGLGETVEELVSTFADIRETGCDILTVGQYLSPTQKHIPVERYYNPDEFGHLKAEALRIGFRFVEAGPLVRSSYHAGRHADGVPGGGAEYSQTSEIQVVPGIPGAGALVQLVVSRRAD